MCLVRCVCVYVRFLGVSVSSAIVLMGGPGVCVCVCSGS